MSSREGGRKRVASLVNRFSENYDERMRANSTYNDTQLRSDFLNAFLQALSWYVFNEKHAPQGQAGHIPHVGLA